MAIYVFYGSRKTCVSMDVTGFQTRVTIYACIDALHVSSTQTGVYDVLGARG